MSKKDVHKLPSEPGPTPILLGISSHENDYRLSWGINETLGFRLVKTDNYSSYNPRLKADQEFTSYTFNEDEDSSTYHLISNRCDNGFLLEELRNIDYLLRIETPDSSFDIKDLITRMRTVPFIFAVFHIDINSLKSKKRLL